MCTTAGMRTTGYPRQHACLTHVLLDPVPGKRKEAGFAHLSHVIRGSCRSGLNSGCLDRTRSRCRPCLERVMGIEPTSSAWKAEVLPLNYTREAFCRDPLASPEPNPTRPALVEGVGFEPTKAEPPDLQSGPFGRSGTPPQRKRRILLDGSDGVKLRRTSSRGHFILHPGHVSDAPAKLPIGSRAGGTHQETSSQSRGRRNRSTSWASGVPGAGVQS